MVIFGKTSDPLSKAFTEFQDKWTTINTSEKCVLSVESEWLSLKKNAVVDDIMTMLSKDPTFIRDDYQEVAELTLIILGFQPPRGTHFHKPGGHHHARWMSSILYYMKMYLFSKQMGYNSLQIEKLRRITIFMSIFYSIAWLKAPIASEALSIDLKFYTDMQRYRYIDTKVAEAVLEVLDRHQWYLTGELAAFGFCSSSIDEAEKDKAARKLLQLPPFLKLGIPNYPTDTISINTNFADLISGKSWLVFHLLSINTDWLKNPSKS